MTQWIGGMNLEYTVIRSLHNMKSHMTLVEGGCRIL